MNLYRRPLACRTIVTCAAWSGTLSPSTSLLGTLSPWWPCGNTCLPGSLQRLDFPLDLPAPLSRTCSQAQVWRRRRQSAPSECLCGITPLHLLTSMPRCGLSSTDVCHPLVSAAVSVCLGFLGVGGGSVSSLFPSVFHWHYVYFGGHSRGFIPLGQLFHSGVVNAPRQLDSPSHSLATPPGVFCPSRGLASPLSASHS